ncbi:hypothetical protein FDP41_007124 [Naegleria fowleri]|uniref:ubiquitinyl hydrolase 1 n=1 Tax=Naegleria fowleri TaxID=5763 RepID=A0A6A5B8K9_NAEFO|nr:uncharacterized protein FDP41_007124 [Naegleria fowleri]KAF0973737.1 hypothetical protein FDP41_007124 [Naegleria fowleri]
MLPQQSSVPSNSDENYTFEQFENQQRSIEQEIKKFPLVDPIASPLTLSTLAYNVGDQVIQEKIGRSYLLKKYSHIRGIRGDGNCFIRAFVFGLLDFLIRKKDKTLTQQMIDIIDQHYKYLIEVLNYPEHCLEDFYSITKEVFEKVRDGVIHTVEGLLEHYFSDKTTDLMMTSQAIVCFMRFLLSGHIQMNCDDYLPFFLDQYATAKEFCHAEIEIMDRDCDNIHLMAMTSAFKVCIRVEVLDAQSRASDKFDVFGYTIPECSDKEPVVYLLFRPGHYEIIYPRENQ